MAMKHVCFRCRVPQFYNVKLAHLRKYEIHCLVACKKSRVSRNDSRASCGGYYTVAFCLSFYRRPFHLSVGLDTASCAGQEVSSGASLRAVSRVSSVPHTLRGVCTCKRSVYTSIGIRIPLPGGWDGLEKCFNQLYFRGFRERKKEEATSLRYNFRGFSISSTVPFFFAKFEPIDWIAMLLHTPQSPV